MKNEEFIELFCIELVYIKLFCIESNWIGFLIELVSGWWFFVLGFVLGFVMGFIVGFVVGFVLGFVWGWKLELYWIEFG